ncbi:MAG: hypothetical protein OSA97_14290, partial [Nevskia sp.]|nr:hypothetical protein [Nevskia sp.]
DHQLERSDANTLFYLIDRRHSEIVTSLLRQWRFPEDIASVPEAYLDTAKNSAQAPSLADVVAVASLLARPLETPGQEPPDLSGLPAAHKLGLVSASDFYGSDAMQIDLEKCMGLLN